MATALSLFFEAQVSEQRRNWCATDLSAKVLDMGQGEIQVSQHLFKISLPYNQKKKKFNRCLWRATAHNNNKNKNTENQIQTNKHCLKVINMCQQMIAYVSSMEKVKN